MCSAPPFGHDRGVEVFGWLAFALIAFVVLERDPDA
jgi:hypothetical protein